MVLLERSRSPVLRYALEANDDFWSSPLIHLKPASKLRRRNSEYSEDEEGYGERLKTGGRAVEDDDEDEDLEPR